MSSRTGRPRQARFAAWLASSAAVLPLRAAEPPGLSFIHQDWALVCDNTGACRAEGYQAEDGGSEPVSLQVTRLAGPGQPASMALAYATEKEKVGAPFRFTVGNARVDRLSGETLRIPDAAAAGLLPELLRNETARLASARGGAGWTLSLAGLKAVLLKMDEVQGRLDTPGALVRRGDRPESTVPGAVPAPVIHRVALAAPRSSDAALGPRILASIKPQVLKEQCNDAGGAPAPEVVRLTGSRVVLALPCAQGAYNFTFLLFGANDKPPYGARLSEADGEFDGQTGVVRSSMKGRGLGDCWSSKTWVFDGNGFALAESSASAMCRGFPGGAWSSPTYVTRVEPPL